MQVTIVTNNKKIKALQSEYDELNVIYNSGEASDVIDYSYGLLLNQNMRLLNDPMSGRLSRPTPYLSLIFTKSNSSINPCIWEKLSETYKYYQQRKIFNTKYPKSIIGNFADVDFSLISAALPKII